MAQMTVQQAATLVNAIKEKRLDYEIKIYNKLSSYCPQIAWYNRKQKASFLVDELIRLLPWVDNTYNNPTVAPPTIRFLNENMKLFEEFITYEKKYPFIAECKLFRFRDTGNPNAGNQFGLCWIIIADSVEVVLNDGKRIAKNCGLQILSRPPMAPGEKITLSSIYYGQGEAKIELHFDDIIQEFSDHGLRDLITNWLLTGGIQYTSGMQLPNNLFIDGATVIHYGWWNAVNVNLINFKNDLKNNPGKYEQFIYKKICGLYPQLKYQYVHEKAKTYKGILEQQINACKIENNKMIISQGLIECISANAYIFDDFLAYYKKPPFIIESQIFNFPGNQYTGLCWLTNGGEASITLPQDKNVTIATGLKILSKLLAPAEEIKIKLTSVQYNIVLEVKLGFGRLIKALMVPRLVSLIKSILLSYGIEYRDEMPLQPGGLYNASALKSNKFLYLNIIGQPGQYTKYPLFSEKILQGSTKSTYDSDFRSDYHISYEAFVRNTAFNINLYSGPENNNYVPIIDNDIDKVSQWVATTSGTPNPVSFQLAKELLIRLRLECSAYPVGIHTDDISQLYNPASGGSRRVEIKDGDGFSKYTFGLKRFWDKLQEIERNGAGKALDEFKRFMVNETFATNVYNAWKSVDWETFFENYLMIGFTPETASASVRKLVHISDLHIGKNGVKDNLNQAKKTITDIMNAYQKTKPKPVVIVTGDIVDFGFRDDDEARHNLSIQNLNDAFNLLGELWFAGFPVIMLPGNHDYSSAIGGDDIIDLGTEAEITAAVTLLTAGTGTVAIVKLIEGAKAVINYYLSPEKGYKAGFISGITYDGDAKRRFESQVREYLKGWQAGSAYEYCENYLRPKKNMSFAIIDNQDLNKDAPWWADALSIDDMFFMGNGDFRFARGYVNETQRNQLKTIYNKNMADSCVKIFCIHNWVDYYPHAIPQTIKPICIDLFNLVLNKAASVNYDGTKVKCWDVGVDGVVHEPIYNSFFYKLFEYVTKNNIADEAALEAFLNSIRDEGRRPQIVDLSWPLFRDMHVPDPPKIYFSNRHNPNIIDDYDSHKITNETDLFSFLEQSDLYMVGHRHRKTAFTNPGYVQMYQEAVDNCINQMTQTMNSPEMVQNKQKVATLRNTLTQNARNLSKDPRQLLMDFFKGLDIYVDSNQKPTGERVFGQICDYLVTNTFTIDMNAERIKYIHAVPKYYSEVNDVQGNRTWREITVNLQTGEMSAIDHVAPA
jgi:hypothetical protein